jgi:polyhydroxybutyrate depolymerase
MRAIVAQLVTQQHADPGEVYARLLEWRPHGAASGPRRGFVRGVIVIAANLPTSRISSARWPTARALDRADRRHRRSINPYNGGPVTLYGFGSRGNVRSARAGAQWFAQTLGWRRRSRSCSRKPAHGGVSRRLGKQRGVCGS